MRVKAEKDASLVDPTVSDADTWEKQATTPAPQPSCKIDLENIHNMQKKAFQQMNRF